MTSDDLPENSGLEEAALGDLLSGQDKTPPSQKNITYQENEKAVPGVLADGTAPRKDHRLGHRKS
ncbi:MAG: hypothetical protein JJ879_02160 [Sneathiella sp.]|nr:hypothetical protein [Sneathiella sp.]